MNTDRKKALHYTYKEDNSGLAESYVRRLMVDQKNRIWIATDTQGVNVFNRANESFIHISSKDVMGLPLVDNRIRSMLEDDRGHIWLGSFASRVKWTPKVRQVLKWTRCGILPPLQETLS